MSWLKDIAAWRMGRTLYLSVPFSWKIPQAQALARRHKGPVVAGGPAVDLNPGCLPTGELPGDVRPLDFHNPLATFTSRGCVNRCSFCAVSKIEGELHELDNWPVRPIVCDNNLLACSRRHFDRVIDRLRPLEGVDFNQGLDARRFTPHHARRIAELKAAKVRFAFDNIKEETTIADAFALAKKHGVKNIQCYVLIGYCDTPDDAKYRLEKVREWGGLPNPMRYQPLDATQKNSFVGSNWSEGLLRDYMRYYSRLNYLGWLPFTEYKAPTLFDVG
jgi:hypothetical protein